MREVVDSDRKALVSETPLALQRMLPPWDALLERLPIGISICDHTGRLIRFNRRAAELWGRGAEAAPGPHTASQRPRRVAAEPLPLSQTLMNEVLRTGEAVHDRDFVLRRSDGTHVVIRTSVEPLLDDAGDVVGCVNWFQDVTNHRQTEGKLHENERQLREILNALPAAVYTSDGSGRITFFNRAAVELAGRTPELGSDKWCVSWRLQWPDGQRMPHEECPMAVTLKENRPVRGAEAIVERPDGTCVPILPFPTPLRDTSGALTGAVNMLVDISSRKEAEANQRLLLDEMNHRVKNNMQILYSLLTNAQREAGSADGAAALSGVRRRVAAMAAAQQVLYFGGLSTRFAAKDLLESLYRNSEPLLGRQVKLEIAAASGNLPNDKAMPVALILNELLTNAATHGVNGRGEVLVKLGLFDDGNCFRLHVEDDGPGFELTTPHKRSSGLGLVLGLVHQIGGTFEVARTAGARCTVHFPRV